jgi:hypothetical protein
MIRLLTLIDYESMDMTGHNYYGGQRRTRMHDSTADYYYGHSQG